METLTDAFATPPPPSTAALEADGVGEASIVGEGVLVSVDEAVEPFSVEGEGVNDVAAPQELLHAAQAASIGKSPGEVGKVVYCDAWALMARLTALALSMPATLIALALEAACMLQQAVLRASGNEKLRPCATASCVGFGKPNEMEYRENAAPDVPS